VRSALAFGRLFLFSPVAAAAACEHPAAWRHGLRLYAVLMPLQLASAWFNPLSFLDPNAPVGRAYGALFWIQVALWQPVIFSMSIYCVVVTLEWLRRGSLPIKLATTVAWAAVPLGLSAYYAQQAAPPRALFIAVFAAWAIPSILVARRVSAEHWRKIATFMLGLCTLQIVLLLTQYLTVVPARSYRGFVVFALLAMVWMLRVASVGLQRLTGMPLPRVALGFLLAMFVILVVPTLAFMLGLMPEEVLKVVILV
jgi:hypothetical protein